MGKINHLPSWRSVLVPWSFHFINSLKEALALFNFLGIWREYLIHRFNVVGWIS